MDWLVDHIGTVVVSVCIVAAVVCAVIFLVLRRKNGTGGCSGNCAGCPMKCHGDAPKPINSEEKKEERTAVRKPKR